ncbi:MAG: hypothetical protein WCZ72_00015 [Gemmobacter sp.]
MVRLLVAGMMALASAAQAESPPVTTGPVLVGDKTRAECRVALDMATAAFRSTSPLLIWPVPLPDADLARLVLSRKDRDISGGDGVLADPAVFERMQIDPVSERMRRDEPPIRAPILHWQREAPDGHRIVVVETPHSWRGSWYSLFLVDATFALDSFPQAWLDARRANFMQPEDGPPILLPVLYEDSWATPTILRDEGSGDLWVLEQGHFRLWQPEWQVHVLGTEGFSPLCRVLFIPDGSPGLDRMPPAMRRFARFADEALGPGQGALEGTLQPTARIRNRVAHRWTMLAERPWALTDTPYNSREEVEAGLSAWAAGVPARVRLHRNLLASLEPAEEALAGFLAARFAIGQDEARAFSSYAIDHMLRSHFTFRSEVGGYAHTPSATPWPESIR